MKNDVVDFEFWQAVERLIIEHFDFSYLCI